ncbi:MAG: tetratricopeptide repeat protein [Salinivirgaceae bacterium]
MKINNILIIILLVNALLFASCSTQNMVSTKEKNSEQVLSEEQLFKFKYEFFEANKLQMLGDYDLAISKFNNCLLIDSTSAVVYYKLASIYIEKKDFVLAEKYAEKAILYNDSNIWYYYLAGNLYSQNNEYKKAINVFRRLIALSPNEMDFYLNLSDTYLKQKDYTNALKVYDEIDDSFGISEVISMQKLSIYYSLNKKTEALKELQKLSNAFENEPKYERLIADFYLNNNEIVKAKSIYNALIAINNNDGYSHIGLAECYRTEGLFDNSIKEIKLAFQSDEVTRDVKFNLLITFLKNVGSNKDQQIIAYELTEILVKLYPDDPDINTLYADLLLQNSLLKEAKDHLLSVLKVRKDKYEVWEQIILIENELKDWNSLYTISSEALNYFPNQSLLYFFKGFSAFQLEMYVESMNSFEFGYKLITKEDPLKNDYLSFLGEAYHKNNFKEKAYKCFDELILIDPDNHGVKNNYAYYLSIDKLELEKAEQMSKSTILKEPNNATYLDTYAWILFQMKRYVESLKYISIAIANDSSLSAVIIEHYGDILYFNNNIDEAVIQWEKAKSMGNGSGFLNEKILNKKYIE